MKERPNCWIRGDMKEEDYQDDPVRLATIRCPYRIGQIRTFLFGTKQAMDYDCTHSAAMNEHQETQFLPGGGIMKGSVHGYATFCEPVDMHLTSLGIKSRYIIEGKCRKIDEKKMLTSGGSK